MNKPTTLQDIANITGISIVSVHKALRRKSGVSERTRQIVCQAAQSLNYKTNEAASILGRGERNVVVIIPNEAHHDSYFYRDMWLAIRHATKELESFKINIKTHACNLTKAAQISALKEIESSNSINAVVVVNCYEDEKITALINKLHIKGVPVVTVNSDNPGSQRLCSVSAPNKRAGELAGELMACAIKGERAKVLIFGDINESDTHKDNAKGFVQMLKKLNKTVETENIPLNMQSEQENTKQAIAAIRRTQNSIPACGAYAINARSTISMCKAAKNTNLNACLIGSDVFFELIPFFEDNTLLATIWKDPYEQMKKSLEIIKNWFTTQSATCESVRIGVVMQSNLCDYMLKNN